MRAAAASTLLALLSLLAAAAATATAVSPRQQGKLQPAQVTTVSYDSRALIVNGSRQLLLAGAIHYPRAPVSQWKSIIQESKAAGLNTIQLYAFWDLHEPKPGVYNFAGRADIRHFLQLVQQEGMYAVLRIGPYVCAEWNYGGFPAWLRDLPGVDFRTYNQPFMNAMESWTKHLTAYLADLFAHAGGPIIAAQIENEYGSWEWYTGAAGEKYIHWAIDMAQALSIPQLPWIMCKQDDMSHANTIDTCNGFYCHDWLPQHFAAHPSQPGMYTELWLGWFQHWGEPAPSRPASDVAYAVARWFAAGGTYLSYYMFFGGTSFARTVGGPGIITSYDYDAPLDEYGRRHQPKYDHLAALHAVLQQHSHALLAAKAAPAPVKLGEQQLAYSYAAGGDSLTFLINNATAAASVKWAGNSISLPAWSVLLLDASGKVLYNTAATTQQQQQDSTVQAEWRSASSLKWTAWQEPAGLWNGTPKHVYSHPPEQYSLTNDTTDYLWYVRNVTIDGHAQLNVTDFHDVLHVFQDASLLASARDNVTHVVTPLQAPSPAAPAQLQLLTVTMGMLNFGAGEMMTNFSRGLLGSVSLDGQPLSGWRVQPGLRGQALAIYTVEGKKRVDWHSVSAADKHAPLRWFSATFSLPPWAVGNSSAVLSLDLAGMTKGFLWVNGNPVGRYWLLDGTQGDCSHCSPSQGGYEASMCRVRCGQPSQRYYRLDNDWLQAEGNVVTLFEEVGGDPSGIALASPAIGVH